MAPDTRNMVELLVRRSEEQLDQSQTTSETARSMHWQGLAGDHYRETVRELYYDAMRARLSLDVIRRLVWG